ncbi:AAA family ATPase [Chromobacterium vaccinii]|uniref:AAA family ATPase n=1 Tax=Chromobacterium vaccinii TaxID=1108595 RepID=UPI0009F60AAB|nr:AAA family ATPase [Chromobacterium vaccinii]
MVQIKPEELLELVAHGVSGSTANFAMLCRRMTSRIKRSDPDLASSLASILATSVHRASVNPVPVDSDSRRKLLQEIFPAAVDVEPVFPPEIKQRLERFVLERNKSTQLLEAGLSPAKSLLFSGPPGVGKTLTAHYLAARLNMPLLTLDLSSVMSSLLGKTGNNIKSVIEYAKGFPCVLLLDEFDAIAKKRDDDRDVGELKRLVNVLLQAIDEWPSTSILIAATNHASMLDPAVWRRFEVVINYDNPRAEQIGRFLIENNIPSQLAATLSEMLVGNSYASLRRIINHSKKEAVLEGEDFVSALIKTIIHEVTEIADAENMKTLTIIHHHLNGLSDRKIASVLGISHPTVGRTLKKVMEKI